MAGWLFMDMGEGKDQERGGGTCLGRGEERGRTNLQGVGVKATPE